MHMTENPGGGFGCNCIYINKFLEHLPVGPYVINPKTHQPTLYIYGRHWVNTLILCLRCYRRSHFWNVGCSESSRYDVCSPIAEVDLSNVPG